jgi:hypothetical protein
MASGLFPRDAPRTRISHAEVALYEAFRKELPAGWTAWHSLRLRVGTRWEGEGDFVIAAPDRGLLVLEVKGGQVELSGGHWLQNGKRLDRAPRDQAQGFVRNLVEAIEKRCRQSIPFGTGCAFPDVDFSDGPLTGDLAGLVLGRRELPWAGAALETLFARAVPKKPMPATKEWIAVLHALWGETWIPSVSLVDRVGDAGQRLLKLNEEQLGVLDVVGGNPRAIVEGGAGTGKTVLARELCLRAAREGKRVLYFCFTDALARTLDAGFEAERAAGRDVRAVPLRRFARELLAKSGMKMPEESTEFWHGVALRAVCDALPAAADRPGLVVVDEGQDFDESDWMLVDELATGAGFWAFLDPRQAFWDRKKPESVLTGATRLVLREQQRNPDAIRDFAGLYAAPVVATTATATDGGSRTAAAKPAARPDPTVLSKVIAAPADTAAAVTAQITRLTKAGVLARDIVVVTLAGRERSALLTLPAFGPHRPVRADADDAAANLVADTFLRFKGLERPFVIVVIEGPKSRYDARMHIALTRAIVGATVIASAEELELDPRLRALG